MRPPDVENFQGIQRNWLVTGNDLENWVATWLRIFGNHVRNPVDPLQKRAVLEAFGQGSLPEEKRAFIDHTEQLFERQFTSRFALLDQLSENRQLLIHGGTGTGKTWHALELAFRHATAGDGRRVLFLTYNKALTAQLRRIVALRQIERGEVVVRGWEEFSSNSAPSPANPSLARHQAARRKPSARFTKSNCPASSSKSPAIRPCGRNGRSSMPWSWTKVRTTTPAGTPEIDALPEESGGWWHIYQLLLKDGRDAPAGIFYDAAQRPPFRAAERFDPDSCRRLVATRTCPAPTRRPLHPAALAIFPRPLQPGHRRHDRRARQRRPPPGRPGPGNPLT